MTMRRTPLSQILSSSILRLMPLIILLLSQEKSLAANMITYDARPDVTALAENIRNSPSEEKLAWYIDWTVQSMLIRADWYLRIRGEDATADEIWSDWTEISGRSSFMSHHSAFDIGDHDPMSPKLSALHRKLEAKLGRWAMSELQLDDLNTLNYAVPVVMHPRRADISKDEYARHFIPLSRIVAFWVGLVACEAAVPVPLISQVCESAAAIGASFMAQNFSVYLANTIWNARHQTR